jgi:hypothetical protein
MQEPIHSGQIAALKKMSDQQKLQAMADMWELSREMLASELRKRYSDWGEEAIWKEVRLRFLAESLGEFQFIEAEAQRRVMVTYWEGYAGGRAV